MPPTDIFVGELEVRTREHKVYVRGEEIPLSSREFEIAAMLAEHPGWVLSAEQLAGDAKTGEGYSPESVSVLVSRIRHKLAAAGADHLVETVRGVGYRLRAARAAEPEDVGELEDPDATQANAQLRDASWQLQESLIDVERTCNPLQRRAVADVLDRTRQAIRDILSE